MTWTRHTRPNLSVRLVREKLQRNSHPYWHLFCYGRALGYQRRAKTQTYWIARSRLLNGKYKQHRVGETDDLHKADGTQYFSYEQAVQLAWEWFRISGPVSSFSDELPIGIREEMIYSPVGNVYTVGHALDDYLEWKRLATSKSNLHTLVSIINFHLLPRLGTLPAEEMNGEHLRKFVRDVLETPPKRGNSKQPPRRSIDKMDEESLRKRKASVNAAIGVLRMALQMAWENSKVGSDRTWRALRRIPNVVQPRTLHLSRPECRRLLKQCQPDLARLVLAALYTGCRATELLRMQVSHVGRDGYGVYVTPVKRYKPRFVFLPDEGMAFFLQLAKGKHANDPLFIRDDGKLWYCHHQHKFRAAELPDAFTFHGLRHTYASQLVQAGAPLIVVADQLGHANCDTVSRTYGHLSPQVRESEVRQRFATVSMENARFAARQQKSMKRWRNSLHGGDWRTYAAIADLKSRSN